jgi:chromosome partitioning protein
MTLSRRVTALANQKGGVGKTTTAVNLAACLAERNRKTLLIDLDPQANASSGLGVTADRGQSLYRVLLSEEPLADRIQPTPLPGLDIIPSEVDLAGAEVDIARTDAYLHRVRNALHPLIETSDYEHVIIDCPPSLGILTVNGLAAADYVIVPIQCEYYALEGLSVIHRIVRQMRESGANPDLELEGILMTMYDARTRLSQQVVDEVRRHFGDRVYSVCIPRTVRLSEAPSYGQPIIVYDSRSAGALAYRQFATEFLQRRGTGHPALDATPAETAPSPPNTIQGIGDSAAVGQADESA